MRPYARSPKRSGTWRGRRGSRKPAKSCSISPMTWTGWPSGQRPAAAKSERLRGRDRASARRRDCCRDCKRRSGGGWEVTLNAAPVQPGRAFSSPSRVRLYAPAVNKMSGGTGEEKGPPSVPSYKLTPKRCPTRAGRLKAATSRAMSSRSAPNQGMT